MKAGNLALCFLILFIGGGGFGCASTPTPPPSVNYRTPQWVKGITLKRTGKHYLLLLEVGHKPTYTVFRLVNPLRLVIDLAEMRFPRNIGVIPLRKGIVSQIRVRQFGDQSIQITRLEITLKELVEYDTWVEGERIFVRFQPIEAAFAQGRRLVQVEPQPVAPPGEEVILEELFQGVETTPPAQAAPPLEAIVPPPPPVEEKPAPPPETAPPPVEAQPAPPAEAVPPPLEAQPLPPVEEVPPLPPPVEEKPAPPPEIAPPPVEAQPAPPAEIVSPPVEALPAPPPPIAEQPPVPAEEAERLAIETLAPSPEAIPVATRITAINWDSRSDRFSLRIELDGSLGDYSVFRLDGPPRLVADLTGVKPMIPERSFDITDSPWIKGIRIGEYPEKTRVVLDLKDPRVQFQAHKINHLLEVTVTSEELPAPPPMVEIPPPPPAPEVALRPTTQPPAAPPTPEAIEAPPLREVPLVKAREAEFRVREAPRVIRGPEKKKYTGRRMSLDFQDADIESVLRLIAEVSNLNIITDEEVKGTVSIRLINVPWDQALDIILQSKQLGMRRMDNIIRIAPQEKLAKEDERRLKSLEEQEKLLPLFVRVVPINYADAKQVADRIKPLLSERGKVDVDSRTNVLIIKDIERNIEDAVALIRSLDTPTPQVLIEAKIVEANTNFIQELGIQWGGGYRVAPEFGGAGLPGRGAVLGSSLGPGPQLPSDIQSRMTPGGFAVDLPAAVGRGSGGAIEFLFGTINNSLILDLRLSALESSGEGRIISSPRIATLDHEKAEILQGIAIPYSTVSAQGTQVQFVDAALKLEVTPHITPDRSILLEFHVSKNAPDPTFTTGAGAPAIAKKEAKSRMLVGDGETAVVGGIFTLDRGTSVAAVPVLSRIPVIGWLFKRTQYRDTKTELLLFVTPRIIVK